MIRNRLLLASVVVLVASGAGCRGCDDKPAASSAPFVEQPRTAKLLSDLSVFALGEPLERDEAQRLSRELSSGALTMDAYIDGLLKQPMGARLAKDLVISPSEPKKDRHPIPVHSVLRHFKEDGRNVYYLKERCRKSEAVEVQAWWEKGPTVLVCPSAYRPEVKGDDEGRTCGASMLSPRDVDRCGCGPALMYCTYGKKHFNRSRNELWREVKDTVAHVVNENLPIEQLFTMNETVRTDTAEAIYRRARVAAGESPAELFPVRGYRGSTGGPRPRHEMVPGQHAGVLTTPAFMYASDALRGVMRNFYDYLWCAGVSSSRVTTESVLNLDVVDLRVGDGWKQLASMPICTDCHARLDYGMQFFWGYPSSTMGVDFRPSLVIKGKGKLYNENIDDVRGEDDLTPAGFARLAVAQPEFGACMTRKVTDHVFGGSDRPDDYGAVHDAFEETHRIKDMLRVAMKRYAERELQPSPAPAAPPSVALASAAANSTVDGSAPIAGADVPISKALRRMLDNDCMQCHDEGDAFDFNGDAFPRVTLLRMIDKVGFFAMPLGTEKLSDESRRRFVNEVARHLYVDDQERDIAASFFANGMRAHSAHRIRAAMESVSAATGAEGRTYTPSTIETAVQKAYVRYTPGVGLAAAVSAVASCKSAKLEGAALQSCIERASAPSTVIAGSITPPEQTPVSTSAP